MTVSFQPAPRKPGQLRLALAPMVRVARKRLAFNVLNDEIGEIEYKSPEMFYMNIIVDIPLDSFLVLAPSNEAVWPTTIGHKFFTKDLPAEQLEQVIVVTARPFRTDEPQ